MRLTIIAGVAIGLAVVGAGLAGLFAPADTRLPDVIVAEAFADVPDVMIRYYDIDATDPKAIRTAMDRDGWYDRGEKRRFDAHVEWRYNWSWPGYGLTDCDLSRLRLSFVSRAMLPRLQHFARMAPADAQAWREYLSALAAHEAGHLRNAQDGTPELHAAIREATCADADKDAQTVIARLSRGDRAFDATTRHGNAQGAIWPLRRTTPWW